MSLSQPNVEFILLSIVFSSLLGLQYVSARHFLIIFISIIYISIEYLNMELKYYPTLVSPIKFYAIRIKKKKFHACCKCFILLALVPRWEVVKIHHTK